MLGRFRQGKGMFQEVRGGGDYVCPQAKEDLAESVSAHMVCRDWTLGMSRTVLPHQNERFPKTAETKKQRSQKTRKTTAMIWGLSCLKRDLRKTEEEEKWREKVSSN